MTFHLVLREEAEADITSASLWYMEHHPERVTPFLRDVDECIAFILRSPMGPARINAHFRQFSLKGFPYLIVYTVIRSEVMIVRVFHMRRDPRTKLRKPRKR